MSLTCRFLGKMLVFDNDKLHVNSKACLNLMNQRNVFFNKINEGQYGEVFVELGDG